MVGSIALKYRIVIYLLLAVFAVCVPDTKTSLMPLSLVLLFITADSLLCYNRNGIFFMLMIIFSITNISLLYGCFCFYKNNAYSWQVDLIGTTAHVITAKAFTVFFITMMIGILLSYKRKNVVHFGIWQYLQSGKIKMNAFLFACVYLIMLYILIFNFNRSVSEYSTGKSAVYEYVVLLFLIIYLYMPPGKIYKSAMLFYSGLYILQGLFFGDRSSAFPMIILLYLLLQKNFRYIQFVILSFVGVLGANLIGIYRRAFMLTSGIFDEVVNRFLYVDSIAYSFYSGVQIINASKVMHDKLDHFFEWVKYLFIGGSSNADLAIRVYDFSGAFYNTGGGMTSSYFYYWGGIPFVILGGLFIGVIIGKIYSRTNSLYLFLQIIILVFCLRWYSYFPNVLFRTCIIVPIVLYQCFLLCVRFVRNSRQL